MKSSLPLLLLLLTLLNACEKNASTSSDAQVQKLCLKGRYVARACNGSAIVQVTEPIIDSLKESFYLSNDGAEKTENVIITFLPDEFRDGEPFYFNLQGTFATYIHDAVCSWPKYAAEITGMGHEDCIGPSN
jgi:hypothetical protein